jgi:hypothetical protein
MKKSGNVARVVTASASAISATAALGGFLVGFGAGDGHALALACLLSGIALSLVLWIFYSPLSQGRSPIVRIMVGAFSLASGLALYSNPSYLLWGLGFPVAIRAFENGAIKGKWWLPPLTLIWAVLWWRNLIRAVK